jgi:hypothetical protein
MFFLLFRGIAYRANGQARSVTEFTQTRLPGTPSISNAISSDTIKITLIGRDVNSSDLIGCDIYDGRRHDLVCTGDQDENDQNSGGWETFGFQAI